MAPYDVGEPRPLFLPEERPYRSHVVFERVFSGPECDAIVELGESLPREGAHLEDTERPDDPSLRQATIAWLGPGPGASWIFDRLAEVTARANEQYHFDLVGFTEDLQYTVYDRAGAFYAWHQDGLDGAVAGRKLSLVFQLSAPGDYEGGDIEFLDVAEDYPPEKRRTWRRRVRKRGAAIAFPAFEYHRVRPIESGTRRSLVCWIGGPPFR